MDVLDLFQRYRDDVYRLALNYTRSPQEAEDVSQTVFLKLMEQEDLIPGREKAWLIADDGQSVPGPAALGLVETDRTPERHPPGPGGPH